MAQLYTQSVPRFAAWTVIGPPTATSVMAAQSIQIAFDDGSTVTIAPNVPAILPDSSTTWDRAGGVYVLYVLMGDGTLRAQRESQLATISGDYAPVARVLHDTVKAYQPMQPGGAAIKSGAWSGGAFIGSARAVRGGGYYGIFDSQSVRGGGSVSGVAVQWSDNHDHEGLTYGGFYYKVATLPSGDMTLLDLDGGATAYFRAKLTSAGHVVLEISYHGAPASLDLTPASGTTTGTWYWVAFSFGSIAGSTYANNAGVVGQVSGPGGASEGRTMAQTGNIGITFQEVVSSRLGWGKSLSSGYQDFPTTAGNELSKLEIYTTTVGNANDGFAGLAPLTSDPVVGSQTALYLCRQTVGPVATITDSTANHYDLTATAGSTIVSDGPYP